MSPRGMHRPGVAMVTSRMLGVFQTTRCVAAMQSVIMRRTAGIGTAARAGKQAATSRCKLRIVTATICR